MPCNPDARTSLDFRQTVALRVGTGAAAVTITGAGTELWRVMPGEEVPHTIQRRIWWGPGRFYAVGGYLEVAPYWKAEAWPQSEEARNIERDLGLPVYALFEKQEVQFLLPQDAVWVYPPELDFD